MTRFPAEPLTAQSACEIGIVSPESESENGEPSAADYAEQEDRCFPSPSGRG